MIMKIKVFQFFLISGACPPSGLQNKRNFYLFWPHPQNEQRENQRKDCLSNQVFGFAWRGQTDISIEVNVTCDYLYKQIEYYYVERNETGHPYVFIFIQLKELTQFKIELTKRLFPHLIYCLLLLPIKFNLRQTLSKNFTCLLEQLIDNKNEYDDMTYSQIAKLIFRTINYLRKCPFDIFNKRNVGKNLSFNFKNHFWLDMNYFQLPKCASKYQCYSSAILYTDIWTTKQRYWFQLLVIRMIF